MNATITPMNRGALTMTADDQAENERMVSQAGSIDPEVRECLSVLLENAVRLSDPVGLVFARKALSALVRQARAVR